MESFNNTEGEVKLTPKQQVDAITNFDELRQLAFNNSEVGKIYNQDRYNHLTEVAADYMSERYSGVSEDGYLVDNEGKETDFHITQIDTNATEESFFQTEKMKLLEEL